MSGAASFSQSLVFGLLRAVSTRAPSACGSGAPTRWNATEGRVEGRVWRRWEWPADGGRPWAGALATRWRRRWSTNRLLRSSAQRAKQGLTSAPWLARSGVRIHRRWRTEGPRPQREMPHGPKQEQAHPHEEHPAEAAQGQGEAAEGSKGRQEDGNVLAGFSG